MDLITTPVVFGQSPPENSIVHSTSVSLTNRSPSEPVHLVQYDDTLPIVAVALTSNGQPYTVPSGAAVNVRLAKPDGTYVYNPAYGVSSDGQTVYIAITVQMTVVSGKVSPIVEIVLNGAVAGTGFFVLDIDPNPIPEDAIESTDEYKTIQQILAEVQQAAQIITDNKAAIQAIGENLTAIQQAPTAAANAAASATLSQSWAVGGTGTREGENTNNAQYYAQLAQQVSQGAVGWYETEQALQAAHPTGQNGNWAIIGTTDTIWTWDSDTGAWVDTGAQVDMSNYYTKDEANATFVQSASLLDLVYPVGSVYMSANNVSPQTFLGGTWQQIQGQFLLAASSTYPAGSTGGEATHTLTKAELPNTKLTVEMVFSGTSGSSYYSVQSGGTVGPSPNSADAGFTKPLGSGEAHNNMPPYLAVYMWKRTA